MIVYDGDKQKMCMSNCSHLKAGFERILFIFFFVTVITSQAKGVILHCFSMQVYELKMRGPTILNI